MVSFSFSSQLTSGLIVGVCVSHSGWLHMTLSLYVFVSFASIVVADCRMGFAVKTYMGFLHLLHSGF